MKKIWIFSATVLAVLVIFSYWVWRSGSLWLFLEERTSIEENCSNSGLYCFNIFSKRGTGIDYTTQVYVFWDQDFRNARSLPEDYLVFEPEVSVRFTWVSETQLEIEYEGGEYDKFGTLPKEYSVKMMRADSAP